MYRTEMQKQIERTVTNGRGYDRKNTARTPFNLMDKEIGVQIALANMDTIDGKLDLYDVIGFSSKLDTVLKKFEEVGMSLYAVTDANGFKSAMDSAYSNPKDIANYATLVRGSTILDDLMKSYGSDDKDRTPPKNSSAAA